MSKIIVNRFYQGLAMLTPKKVQSKAIKVPQDNEKSKEKDR